MKEKSENVNSHKCEECNMTFKGKDDLERHCWKSHPKNKYEKAWSKINFSSYSGSSFYKDDPYY